MMSDDEVRRLTLGDTMQKVSATCFPFYRSRRYISHPYLILLTIMYTCKKVQKDAMGVRGPWLRSPSSRFDIYHLVPPFFFFKS